MSLRDKLKGRGDVKPAVARGPLWKGPEEDGVTFSLLSRFLVCRERFRALVVEGLRPVERFNAAIEYGQMWHTCEESLAGEVRHFGERVGTTAQEDTLRDYCKILCKRYPLQQDEVNHWYEFCKATFPIYVEWWAKHPDVIARTPLLSEQTFNVPYTLPSGRTVRLQGKWDSVDLVRDKKTTGIWVQENKTKSQIDQRKLSRQLTFDLQTMIYVVALEVQAKILHKDQPTVALPLRGSIDAGVKIAGVRYNVVRRSAHRSVDSMLKKLHEDIEAGRGQEWFSRWNVDLLPSDVKRFRERCLDPILENLCCWWDGVVGRPTLLPSPFMSWVHPFGVYNVLDEGGSSDLDEYITTGSEVGLRRVDDLFPELKEG